MKHLKFKREGNVLVTDEFLGYHDVYKAYLETASLIWTIESSDDKVIKSGKGPNLLVIKKKIKKELKLLGVKFDLILRNQLKNYLLS